MEPSECRCRVSFHIVISTILVAKPDRGRALQVTVELQCDLFSGLRAEILTMVDCISNVPKIAFQVTNSATFRAVTATPTTDAGSFDRDWRHHG